MVDITKIAAIYADAERYGGMTVTVGGWAKTIRDLKTFGFIELNDGSCFRNLQVVMDANILANYKEIAAQNVGAALIVIGGLKRVAAVTEKLVPLMALFYIAGALIIVVMHAGNIPAAFGAIFKGAFNLQAAGGGALGYGISQTITWGFKRGAFSNEAGLGSAVMVNSASNVKEPVHQGMWGVFEVFADTIVVCTLTALVILTTGVVDLQSGAVLANVQDNALVGQAFTAAFGSLGPKFIAISILLFAYSTTLGWSHYGTKAVEYLFGTTGSRIYKVVFVGMTVVGSTMKLGLAWDLSDTFNGLMMIPNLIGVLALSGTVVAITKNYLDRRVKGKAQKNLAIAQRALEVLDHMVQNGI